MDRSRPGWPLTLALCGGYFLVLLDVTVVNVALPQINVDLDAGNAGMAWVVDAYSVPLAALLLVSGAIGDRLGHRRVVLVGFVGFGGTSMCCAVAPTIGWLIAARASQGMGAALMLPGTLALLVENVPHGSVRTRLVGLWAAMGGAALPAGPVIGGLLIQAAGWRVVFWLGVPVIAAALLPVVALSPRVTDALRVGALDWLGAGMLVVGLGCAVSAVVQAADAIWLAGLLGSVAVGMTVALVRVERRARYPLVTVPHGSRRPLAAACLVAALMNLCALGSLFLLTQFLQDRYRLPALSAGLATLPAMLPLPLLGTVAGGLSARLGVWRAGAVGLFTSAAGFVGIATSVTGAGTGTDRFALLSSLAVWGTGLGVLTPAVVAAALHAAPDAPGAAAGASNTSRQAGGALGIAIFSAVAGRADGSGFVPRSVGLFLGGAALFVLLGLLCIAAPQGEGPKGPTSHDD